MEENKQIRIPLREDYRNGDLLRGRDVNKITHRVNELTGDIDKIDIDLSGKLDTSAYTEDKAAIESRIDGVAEGLSTKEDISAHTADMEAIRASLDNKVEVSAYTENNTRLDGRINSVVNQCTRLDISKQNKLTAGTNITIENDVISAQQPDLSPYALSADVATELAKKVDSSAYTQDKAAMQASISANTTAITQLETSKQDKLTPGANVQISNGVISATDTKYDLSPYAKTGDVATELAKKADASALTQVSVEINNRIAVDERSISGLEADKQDKLSAGTGIKIENNVVSLSGAGGAMIDDNVTGSTTCWSSQKVYDEMRITLTNLLPTGNVLAF